MNGRADAEEEHRAVEVAPLVRGVDPAHEAEHDDHHPRHAEQGDAVDGHRFAPHDAAKPQHQPGNGPRHQANQILPLAGQAFQAFDAFHEHAAAAGNHERHQAASHGFCGRFAHFHAPGHIAHRQYHRPKPGVDGPERVTGRVGDAGIIRRRAQLPGILECQLGGQCEEISDPDHRKGDEQGQPVNPAEQRR